MEKHVEVLATLLAEEPEVVEEAIKTDGELDKLVSKYKETHHIFSGDELTRKIENAKKEHLDKIIADGQPIPSELYNRVKGNAFEAFEKKKAQKYGIESWTSMEDLDEQIIAKEIAKSGKAGDDELIKERDKKIEELKALVLKEGERAEKAEATAESKVAKRMINMDIDSAVNAVDLDAEGEKLVNQRDLLDASFRRDHTFEYKDNKTIVFDKDGNLMKNKVGDPLSVSEVISDYAPKRFDIKEVSKGGRGASSTTRKPDGGNLKDLKNLEELIEYAEKKEIKLWTAAFYDLMSQAKAANPDIKL